MSKEKVKYYEWFVKKKLYYKTVYVFNILKQKTIFGISEIINSFKYLYMCFKIQTDAGFQFNLRWISIYIFWKILHLHHYPNIL